jgi:hypothetical protein
MDVPLPPLDSCRAAPQVPEQCLSNVNAGQLLHAADKPAVLESVTEKKLVGSCPPGRLVSAGPPLAGRAPLDPVDPHP